MSNLWFQFIATSCALLTILSSGIHEGWTSVYIPKLLDGTEVIKITSEEGSWIILSMSVGGLLGCIVAYFLIDRIGRKKTILITAFPFFISTIIQAYASSVILFCIARIISGIAFGITIAVLPHYIGEIADTEIRGTLSTMISVFSLVGFLFINIIGWYLTITTSSLITAIVPFTLLLTFTWMPESPYYLIMIGEFDKAQKSLKRLKGRNDVTHDFEILKNTVVSQIKHKGKIVDIFGEQSNRRALFIVFILLNGKQLTGIGPVDAYAQLIFGQIFNNLSPLLITLVYYSTRFATVVVSSFFIDKIGRKLMLLISFTGCGLSLFPLALYLYIKSHVWPDIIQYRFLPFFFLEGFAIFYSLLTPIPLTVLGEVFPMNVKAFASFLYEIYLYIITLGVIKCFQLLSDYVGMEAAFFMFSLSCFLHLILIYKYVLETKGRTLDEIQKCLQK